MTTKAIPPVRPCCSQRHFGALCPDGLVMCCICFERVEVSELRRESGGRVNVCKGHGER